jgi:hypothetical protein
LSEPSSVERIVAGIASLNEFSSAGESWSHAWLQASVVHCSGRIHAR